MNRIDFKISAIFQAFLVLFFKKLLSRHKGNAH